MAKKALGMIETRGLAAALEASDAAAKAADITVMEIEIPSAGVCTVKIVGEVGDVYSAVDAGAAAASRVGEVIAHHVIARPDDELDKILLMDKITLSDTSGAISGLMRSKPEEPKNNKKGK